MDSEIKNICLALKEEAEGVISYTNKIRDVTAKETVHMFEAMRLDKIGYIQNLTLELTKIMTANLEKEVEKI